MQKKVQDIDKMGLYAAELIAALNEKFWGENKTNQTIKKPNKLKTGLEQQKIWVLMCV